VALPAIHTRVPAEICLADLEALVGLVEDAKLEFKSGLHYESGQPDSWAASQRLADASAIEIARQVAGFANANGGVVVLGMEESGAEATGLVPLAQCEALADALERSVRARIDPPLPQLDVKAVPSPEDDGSGFIIFRVGVSARRPHIVQAKKSFLLPIRKGRETASMSGREMQDLALR
jgi:predicted HTH transcriptional regulator